MWGRCRFSSCALTHELTPRRGISTRNVSFQIVTGCTNTAQKRGSGNIHESGPVTLNIFLIIPKAPCQTPSCCFNSFLQLPFSELAG